MGIKKKPHGSKTIVSNGTHDVAWKKDAVVNVAGGITTQEKTVTANGTVIPDEGFDAMTQVNVNVPILDTSDATATAGRIREGYTAYVNAQKIVGTLSMQSKTFTANGTYTPDSFGISAFNNITVNVQPTTEERTFTENGTYTPSPGMDGMHSVTVNVPQLDTSDATAQTYHILSGQTAYVNGVKLTGTMRRDDKTISANGTYLASDDYGAMGSYRKVSVNVPQYDSSSATATASDIALGKTAWINNVEVTGTMPAAETVTGTITLSSTAKNITIPQIVGKQNVILYFTGADLTQNYVSLFKCVGGTVDTFYPTVVSNKISTHRIGGTYSPDTGVISTGTTDHKFGITTYTYFAW